MNSATKRQTERLKQRKSFQQATIFWLKSCVTPKNEQNAARFKYHLVSIGSMNTQINLRLPEKLLTSATKYAEKNGYATVQDFLREVLREKLFDESSLSKKEIELALRLAEVSKRKGLYGTEEQLFRALKKQQKVRA